MIQNKYEYSGRHLLKIQDGCDHFCSYCIVPFLRGKPKSKSPEKVIQEIKQLSNKEIKEVILTGINLSLYGKDLKPKISLKNLLEKILKETKIPRISLSSLDPEIIDQDFVNLIIQNPRISRYFHFSLQSGSPSVLERMKRNFNLQQLTKNLKILKKEIPYFVFRADLIIGFPNESEKEFKETLSAIGGSASGGQLICPISFVHVFPYSPRPGTMAFEKIKKGEWQDLPYEIKKEREKILLYEVQKIRNQEMKKMKGKILNCLILRKLKDQTWEALAENSCKILLKDKNKEFKPGEMKKIKITWEKSSQNPALQEPYKGRPCKIDH